MEIGCSQCNSRSVSDPDMKVRLCRYDPILGGGIGECIADFWSVYAQYRWRRISPDDFSNLDTTGLVDEEHISSPA